MTYCEESFFQNDKTGDLESTHKKFKDAWPKKPNDVRCLRDNVREKWGV